MLFKEIKFFWLICCNDIFVQCDIISSGLNCKENEIGPKSFEHVNMLVEKLLVDFETISKKKPFDSMTKEKQLQGNVIFNLLTCMEIV